MIRNPPQSGCRSGPPLVCPVGRRKGSFAGGCARAEKQTQVSAMVCNTSLWVPLRPSVLGICWAPYGWPGGSPAEGNGASSGGVPGCERSSPAADADCPPRPCDAYRDRACRQQASAPLATECTLKHRLFSLIVAIVRRLGTSRPGSPCRLWGAGCAGPVRGVRSESPVNCKVSARSH